MWWQILFGTIFILLLIAIVGIIRRRGRRAIGAVQIAASKVEKTLAENVHFYQKLDNAQQLSFGKRVQDFLAHTVITPVNGAAVTDADKVLVAAAAIMPIFNFKDWRYARLDEVLIYPDAFTKDYSQEAAERNVAGMVGTGAMDRMMILSLPQLRAGFVANAPGNTALHEFVHLIDMSDGATDGIPEELLSHESIMPWIQLMQRHIAAIHQGNSDIPAYGGTNPQEFFAVVSEYFFQRPEQLAENHPKLFALLQQAYGGAATMA